MTLEEIHLTIKHVREDSSHYEKRHFVECIEFLLKDSDAWRKAYETLAMALVEERK